MATNPVDADVATAHEHDETADLDPTQTGTGLDENVAGALTYLFGFVTGILFYFLESENAFVRFHAAQSMVTFGLATVGAVGLTVGGMVLSLVLFSGSTGGFVVGSLVSLLLTVVWLVATVAVFGLWLFLMIRAYQGETPRLPVVAGIADRLV